ncbi:HET domain-containing protein [Trichoderma barbatum]
MELQALYSSLPLKDGDIRVLTILPGEWAADIHCTISVVSLSDTPEYVALSYVWGVPFQDGTLHINGREQRIGRSLETALRYYRQAGWSMPLWADAICINQQNTAERSSQVSIMDRIYSLAATAFVVLGAGIDLAADDYFEKVKALNKFRFSIYGQKYFEAVSPTRWDESNSRMTRGNDEESSVLFSFLEKACSIKIWDHLSVVPQWGGALQGSEEPQYPWQTLIETFDEFTREPWWDRVWTLQESVVSNSPIFIYRTAAAPWAMISEAAGSIRAHVTDCCTPYLINEAPPRYAAAVKRLLAHIFNIENTRQIYEDLRHGAEADELFRTMLFPRKDFEASIAVKITGSLDPYLLYRYLCLHNGRKATDARDKVYALLSLIKLGKEHSIIYPDYDVKLEDVYITTAKRLIQESDSLDLLSVAGRLRGGSFPSWVPDWSVSSEFVVDATHVNSLSMYDATFGTKAAARFPQSNSALLEVEGIILDKIALLGQRIPEGSGDEDMWQAIFQWMQLAHNHSPNTKWVEFCRTICTGLSIFPGSQVFFRMGPLTKEMVKSLLHWKHPASGEYRNDMPPEELTQQSVEHMKAWFRVWYVLLGRQAERGSKGGPPPPTIEGFLQITTALKRFVVSSEGHIGLVPSNSETGDCIIFFKGCRFPCIARPVAGPDDKSKWFRNVGSCYIDGFMNGQIKDFTMQKRCAGDIAWDAITLC